MQSFMSNHNKSQVHYYKNVTQCHDQVSLHLPFLKVRYSRHNHYALLVVSGYGRISIIVQLAEK